MSKIFVIAHHGCVGTFNNKIMNYLNMPADNPPLRTIDTYTKEELFKLPIGIVPHKTILIYFNKYGTKSSSTDSLVFMKEIYLKNKYLFNYVINPENYKHNLDASHPTSYRHKDFFTNPVRGLYSKYNPLTYVDIYVPGMICNNQYINHSKEVNHGIYEFYDPIMTNVGVKPSKSNYSTTFQNIREISSKNKDIINIIFIFVCRLPELTDVNFGLMPTLNPIEDIRPYGIGISEYFSENKAEKIYALLHKSINEISETPDDMTRTIPNITILPGMEISPRMSIIQLTPEKSANNRLLLLKFIKYTLLSYDTFVHYYSGSIDIDMAMLPYANPIKPHQFESVDHMIFFISNNLIQPVFILYNNVIRFNNIISEQFLANQMTNSETPCEYADNIQDHVYSLISKITEFQENLHLNKITFKHYPENEPRLIKYFQSYIRQDKPSHEEGSTRKRAKLEHDGGGYIRRKYTKYNNKCTELLLKILNSS